MDERQVLKQFNIDGELVECTPLGNGHINLTFLCTTNKNVKYVLQRINNQVFRDIDLLMSNYDKVTQFLLDHGFEAAYLIKTKDGKLYYSTDEDYYRLFTYLENTKWVDEIDSYDVMYDFARVFGNFHKALRGFNAEELGETIPNFHNTYQRYLNLLDAIKADKCRRVNKCLPEIEITKRFEKEYSKITDEIKNGNIPLSVTHNDPKINNVLFDATTGEPRAIIDLDTVMPGSYLYDFGDAIRCLFTGENEDSTDLSKLVVNYKIFEVSVRGYLSVIKDVLTKTEIELLSFSTFLIAMELGMRFLEDYLRGDIYFRTKYSEHNLVRARTQLKLATEIHNHLDELDTTA